MLSYKDHSRFQMIRNDETDKKKSLLTNEDAMSYVLSKDGN